MLRVKLEEMAVRCGDVSVCDAFGNRMVVTWSAIPGSPERTRKLRVTALGEDGQLEELTGHLDEQLEFSASCATCDTVVECTEGCLVTRHFVAPSGWRAVEFKVLTSFQRHFDLSSRPLEDSQHITFYPRDAPQ